MLISLIAAMDKQRVIGKNNRLPWHLPADLRHFKMLTLGKPIVMGYHTFESIGKPLPGRQNIVLSRKNRIINDCEVFHSLEAVIHSLPLVPQIMIIGGSHLFREALPIADTLYLTIIDHCFDGDTFFPIWRSDQWILVSQEEHPADHRNAYAYSFLQLNRRL